MVFLPLSLFVSNAEGSSFVRRKILFLYVYKEAVARVLAAKNGATRRSQAAGGASEASLLATPVSPSAGVGLMAGPADGALTT